MPRSTPTADPVLTGNELRCLASEFAEFFATGELWRLWLHLGPARGDPWCSRVYADAGVDVWLLTWAVSRHARLLEPCESGSALSVVHGELDVACTGAGRTVRSRLAAGQTQTALPGFALDVHNGTQGVAVSISACSPRRGDRSGSEPPVNGLGAIRAFLVHPEGRSAFDVAAQAARF